MANIKIQNYIPELLKLNDTQFTEEMDNLIEELSVNEPYKWMIKGCINNATKPFASDSYRDISFQKLVDFDLSKIAVETFEEVIELLPRTPIDEITCYIFPAILGKGGGCNFAPGKILLSIVVDDLAPIRLKRNVAHEYSHTVRSLQKPMETEFGYGEAVPYSMRDYLILEGLAMVLGGEVLYPHPDIPGIDVSAEREQKFWNNTDLDAIGMNNAYIKYMTLTAYEIGSRIVRSYLATNQISIFEAHHLSDRELYWNSGYPFIR